MKFSSLEAISPVDGRYRRATAGLADYFSEGALIRYRVLVEVGILYCPVRNAPCPQLSGVDKEWFKALRNIYKNFSLADADHVKAIEKTTNHDVKAVEYFLKEKFDELGLQVYKEFIHLGLTSQDVNNTALPLSMKEACLEIVMPTPQ